MLDETQAAEVESLFADPKERAEALRAVIRRAEELLARLVRAQDEDERRDVRHALFGLLATYGGKPLVEDRPKDPEVLRKRVEDFRRAWETRLGVSLSP